jgi:hypothetical protein
VNTTFDTPPTIPEFKLYPLLSVLPPFPAILCWDVANHQVSTRTLLLASLAHPDEAEKYEIVRILHGWNFYAPAYLEAFDTINEMIEEFENDHLDDQPDPPTTGDT